MMDGFNKGDMATVKAAHVASPKIVDNVAPFAWSGPDAFDRWLADLGKAEAEAGKTNGVVTFAPVVDEVIRGDRAYVVTRSSYAYKQKGREMRETGYTSFVLVKAGSEWKVESWSWASPAAILAK
jgi:SnoaL-like domain